MGSSIIISIMEAIDFLSVFTTRWIYIRRRIDCYVTCWLLQFLQLDVWDLLSYHCLFLFLTEGFNFKVWVGRLTVSSFSGDDK